MRTGCLELVGVHLGGIHALVRGEVVRLRDGDLSLEGVGLTSGAPKGGWKTGAERKLSKNDENIFDAFGRFLTFFALREKCRKVSKIFLTLFDDF